MEHTRNGSFVRLQNHVPERLVLASAGVIREGMYGPQKLYHLADGRAIYLDLDLASRIDNCCEIGKEFWLCKHSGGKGRKTRYDIYHENPMKEPGESNLERDLRLSIPEATRPRRGRVTPIAAPKFPELPPAAPPMIEAPPVSDVQTSAQTASEIARKAPAWAETLVHQTNHLVDSYAECLKHAADHGLAVRPDDVRTLLVTAFIGLSQRGKGRSNVA